MSSEPALGGCLARLWAPQNPLQPFPPLVGNGVFSLTLSRLERPYGTETEEVLND